MQKTKVLITGAGGFLGQYIARDLLQKGYDVTSFSRGQYPELASLGVHQISGNLKNAEDVFRATQGMDAIVHTASLVGMGNCYQDFFETNVLGTRNILEACKKNNIKKLIYTSTPSVAFGESSLCGVDESIGYPSRHLSHYASTKAQAEKEVLAKNSNDLSTVAIRPHLIYGPGDKNLIPRVVDAAKKGRIKIIGDGNNLVDVSYVENVSAVHVRALENLGPQSSIAGKAYFFGQGPIKLWDFTNEILKREGLPPLKKKIPLKVAYGVGWIIEKISQALSLFGVKVENPPMTRFIALQLGSSHYFSHKQLEQDLGTFKLISIEEGLNRLYRSKN